MNRKRSQLQSYIAGIFDGEGSIGIYRYDRTRQGRPGVYPTYTLRVSVGMQVPTAVAYIKALYPDALFSQDKQDLYRVTFVGNNAYDFLVELLPFLIVKHEQAKIALSYLAHRRRDHQGNHGVAACSRCDRCVENIQKAKQVKTVNLHELREYRAKPEEVEMDRATILGLLEGVETSLRSSTTNKSISACEQEIVHN